MCGGGEEEEVGSGKYMKRRATDWETDEETEMEGEQTRGKGRRGKGMRKSERGPRELYLWRRVVMLEDSPGRICMVFNEEGGARWRRIIKKKKERNEREKHSALNPSLRGKKKNSFKQVRGGITFQVPHSLCFTLEKEGTQIKVTVI